ncbi:hypothetical protein ACRRTK_017239 [Alexandromys fortis]
MGKFMKPGKVVLVLAGRYSGCKVVIMKNIDDDTSDCPYSHAVFIHTPPQALKWRESQHSTRNTGNDIFTVNADVSAEAPCF